MTTLRFRVDDALAAEAQRWAERLGVDRAELLREALRRHLDRLTSEDDAERAFAAVADRGPADDWSDWLDAAG